MTLKGVLTCCALTFFIPVFGRSHEICALPDAYTSCQILDRTLELGCKFNIHSVDCLINIENNRSHVGRINAEEAFLGANLLSERVLVIGEITSPNPPPQTVVVVRNNPLNSIADLKGKRLCHPGYKHDHTISRLVLKELEQKVIELNGQFCSNENTTILEKEIRTLSEFFGESCRPGPWTEDENLDNILKGKYPSLCSLCGSDRCNVDYRAPFNESLKCLAHNGGDIAVTTLNEAEIFFNASYYNTQNFRYLCKNGSLSRHNLPCVWTNQIPSLLVAEKSAAAYVKSFLREKIGSKISALSSQSASNDAYEKALITILRLQRRESLKLFSDYEYKSLKDYVKQYRTVPSPESSIRCKVSLKWCTYSDLEQNKCKWLSQAAVNQGIQPVVECVRSEYDDELSCLSDVQKGRADIVVASTDYGYISSRKNLISLAYPETNSKNLSIILAVKKQNDNSITNFKSLKGKRACIPEYGGKEFLAFVDISRKLEIVKSGNCEYGKLLSDLVEDSCVPGANSQEHETSEGTDKSKLCRQCIPVSSTQTAVYCNADYGNKYFGSNGSLACLEQDQGDFAVITKSSSLQNTTNLRVICKNGRLASSRGLDVDNECALGIIPSSEIVSKEDNVKNPDILLALREFERWFEQDSRKSFQIFDVFNGTVDLLFENSAFGLDFEGKSEYITNYKKSLQDAKTCKSQGNSLKISFFFIFISIVYLF